MDERALLERITANPEIYGGKPIIRGRRLAVEHVLGMIAGGASPQQIVDHYEGILGSRRYPGLRSLCAEARAERQAGRDGEVKLLFDSCMSPRDAAALSRAGHDAVWVGAWPSDPGDREILRRAREEGRVVVTLDSDFGRLVFGDRMHHAGVIWLRNVSPLVYAERFCSQSKRSPKICSAA
ncbi:MAG TPA: DUF5615 family PIN-like protein [Thermoanaerobaculia bacterium]|nr:DUF5615 family PIN-like protein [Thermoanaerobaculia bacterium]